MQELRCLNVPAYLCSHVDSDQGRRLVRFEGEAYAIIGLYLVPGSEGFSHNGNGEGNGKGSDRTLFYILRACNGRPQVGLLLGR